MNCDLAAKVLLFPIMGICICYTYFLRCFISIFSEFVTRFINKTLSVRISLTVVLAIATLLTVALFIMFRSSRKALKEEALQKAGQTLEATVQRIDNCFPFGC